MRVKLLRCSFIWAEATLDRLRANGGKPPGTRWVAPISASTYVDIYPTWRNGGGEIGVPWKEPSGRAFWKYYTPKQQIDQISPTDAYNVQAPGRAKLPWSISADWLNGRIDGEVFVFSFGHALVLSFTLELPGVNGVLLSDAVSLCHKIRRNGQFTVRLETGEELSQDLEGVSSQALSHIRKATTGSETQNGTRSAQPFSVTTFLRLAEVGKAPVVTDQDPVHKAVDAVTSWSILYPDFDPPALSSSLLASAKLGSSQQLYAGPRGRTVWFPKRASNEGDFLGCYHRTLVFLSMQLESLGIGIRDFAQADEISVASDLRFAAKNVCVHLGRLEGQVATTFRSESAPRQIKEAGWLPSLDQVRHVFGMPVVVRT